MEGLPIAGLLMLCVFMTLQAGPVMQFMQKTAASLHNPSEYVQFVLGTKPIPSMPAKQATPKPSL
jgi:multicomponent K+:H+ antiporter subunit D